MSITKLDDHRTIYINGGGLVGFERLDSERLTKFLETDEVASSINQMDSGKLG